MIFCVCAAPARGSGLDLGGSASYAYVDDTSFGTLDAWADLWGLKIGVLANSEHDGSVFLIDPYNYGQWVYGKLGGSMLAYRLDEEMYLLRLGYESKDDALIGIKIGTDITLIGSPETFGENMTMIGAVYTGLRFWPIRDKFCISVEGKYYELVDCGDVLDPIATVGIEVDYVIWRGLSIGAGYKTIVLGEDEGENTYAFDISYKF